MRYITFLVKWLLIFVIGAVLTLLLVSVCYHRYVDHGVGEYYGIVDGTFHVDQPWAMLRFQAESPETFRLGPPQTYIYDSMELTIASDAGEVSGKLYVPEMKLDVDGETRQLSESSFAMLLLGGDAVSHEDFDATINFFALLQSAGSGKFAPPRHHTYQIPFYDPDNNDDEDHSAGGRFVHFSTGKRVPHLLVYWTIAWLMGMTFTVVRDRITMR